MLSYLRKQLESMTNAAHGRKGLLWLTVQGQSLRPRSIIEGTFVEEAGAAGHIAATVTTMQSEEMLELSPLSPHHTVQDPSPGEQ